ncbi:MAG: radical SAM protein [Verrucomicrobia bacterium]|nr:radical SAM protein [Verrucomicrobiota bacterium]
MKNMSQAWQRSKIRNQWHRALFAKKRAELPESLRTPQQFIGLNSVGCGATHSIMEKCNFACSSCYLTEIANFTRPLGFETIKEQLDSLRMHLGARGKVQVTSGEVTLLPVEELGRIVSYARQIGLDPMVMTNGQRLLQVRGYLNTLVEKYGLRKISFHIDTTQKGRLGMTMGLSECDIDPIRERFIELVKDVRRQTGKSLYAAQTITVTPQNFEDIPAVVDWALDHAGTFRILSLLPVAQVGRTADRDAEHITMETVWDAVCAGAGTHLNRHTMSFGHSECNITVPVVVVSAGKRRLIVEVVRKNKTWDQRIFARVIRAYAIPIDVADHRLIVVSQLLWPLLAHPTLLIELFIYGFYRLWGLGRRLPTLAMGLLSLRVKPLLLVVHKFMGRDELETPLGQERLDACTFKLPVDGRMISMCEMNATDQRLRLNRDRLVQKNLLVKAEGKRKRGHNSRGPI